MDKTAIQIAIEKFYHALAYEVEGGKVTPYTWHEFENDLHKLLEKEKQQIIDAHNNGYIDGGCKKKTTAEEYYSQTYQRN